MRFRSRRHPSVLILLLLPTLAATAVALDSTKSKPGSVQHLASDKNPSSKNADLPSAPDARPEVGTKDAPVDGLDGKPHAGPFVDSTKKKSSQQVVDLGAGGETLNQETKDRVLKDTFDLPEDDGVMADVADRKAVTGPTGTEGGVSQKDRERKEKGVSTEKRPDPPKEAPRLQDVEVKSKGKKEGDGEPVEKKKGAAGLEVRRTIALTDSAN
jgi:Ca2+/H+ antiporter, TMEM165/GDT1 family